MNKTFQVDASKTKLRRGGAEVSLDEIVGGDITIQLTDEQNARVREMTGTRDSTAKEVYQRLHHLVRLREYYADRALDEESHYAKWAFQVAERQTLLEFEQTGDYWLRSVVLTEYASIQYPPMLYNSLEKPQIHSANLAYIQRGVHYLSGNNIVSSKDRNFLGFAK